MPGTGGESPTDFNKCVSKNELQKLVDDQRTYIDGKFDELMRTINGLVTFFGLRDQLVRPVMGTWVPDLLSGFG